MRAMRGRRLLVLLRLGASASRLTFSTTARTLPTTRLSSASTSMVLGASTFLRREMTPFVDLFPLSLHSVNSWIITPAHQLYNLVDNDSGRYISFLGREESEVR